jgi:ATP-dependent DNA ligase
MVARDDGVTDFDALRSALASRDGCDAVFLYAFDLIELDGQDLRRHPWRERRAALAKLIGGGPPESCSASISTATARQSSVTHARSAGRHRIEAPRRVLSLGPQPGLDRP